MTVHLPVLLAECLELLAVRPGGLWVDGTLGLGGHAAAILEKSAPDGRLLGVDRDPEALARTRDRLAPLSDRATLVHSDWRELAAVLDGKHPDGILLDLGVSSLQLDDPERGFSFMREGPLDMRMDPTRGPTAAEVVNRTPEPELADIIYQWGEERASRRIARAIVEARRRTPLRTTLDLAAIVRRASPRREHGRHAIDPATRTFQAIRIHVNRELEGLGDALATLARTLAPGGRLVVIAFHSLEDREVKLAFRALALEGFHILTKKPLVPGDAEVRENPRARSAKLRGLQAQVQAEAA